MNTNKNSNSYQKLRINLRKDCLNRNYRSFMGKDINLRQRLKEHVDDVKKRKLTTALASRAYEYNIEVDWNDAKVVRKVNNLKELKMAEKLAIFEGSKNGNVINERQSLELLQAWKFALKCGGS